jgi:hypothetical protein
VELTLKASRLRYVGHLIASIRLVAEGAFLVWQGHPFGWAGILFFGAGVVVFSLQLIPGSAYLKLDPVGFTMCSLFKPRSYRWDEVDSFDVSGSRKSVLSNFSRSHRGRGYLELRDAYGMSAERLAATLNEWRQRSSQLGSTPDQPR